VIIEQITIENWRGYREPHTFRFQEAINLLAGRNEAGKSTLFEALTRVLFDRHNSKAEEIRAIQPIGSTLGPEAKIEFRVNGKRYRVVKSFLQDSNSALYSEREGRWELDHEGDHADARLREILRGEPTTRTAARPEHRGLAQALWYLQSDGAIPEKTWSEGVKQGLQGLVQLAARSPIEKRVVERISECYTEHWTPTGRVATNSELGQLQAELPRLEERLAELVDKAKSAESHRADLEEFLSLEGEKSAGLTRAHEELGELSGRVQAGEALEREREAREHARKEAGQNAQRIQQALLQIEDKQRKIQERRAEIKKLEDSLSEVAMDAKQEATTSERHARHWKEELEPALRDLESELGALHSLERLRKIEKDRKRLEQHLEQIAGIGAQLQARKKERGELVAPDDKEWKRCGATSKKLSVLHAQVEASAIRVAFEWSAKGRNVKTQPSLRASEEGEYIVTEPTEFQIDGVGRVLVRSGASSLKDLLMERDALEREVQQVLTRFGVPDVDGLATLHEKGRELDRVIATLEGNLDETEGTEPDADEELARTKRGIEEETRGAGILPPDILEQGGQWIRDQITVKEREKKRLIQQIDEEQKSEKAAGRKHLELVENRQATSNKLAERKAEIQTYEEGITGILQTYGTIDHLRNLLVSSEAEARKATVALDVLLEGYEAKVTTPKRLHEQAQGRVRELEKQLGDFRNKISATLARIEESAAQGNYSLLADVEIEIGWSRQRVEVLKRRAEGAKLLRDIVLAREKERSAALSGPIQELVNRWLRLLTEDNYDALRIDHDLKPAGVHVARYDADLPLTSLSHGAQEQVVVLLRLGIAVLVSGEERNLVVIDDRLVNADPVRMKRLCLILQEAAKTCQIVVATCNDTPYAGVGAHIVRVPSDGVRLEAGV
jgi:DNA repair exonuclease SbcCD ATPase subunit